MSAEIKLVSPSDIAELAGRTRAAVSNWRANPRLEFPKPAGGTETRPLFALAEVEAWLNDRQGIVIERVPGAEVWSAVNSLRGRVDPIAVMDYVLGLMSLRKLAVEADELSSLRAALEAHPERLDSELYRAAARLDENDRLGLVVSFDSPAVKPPVNHLIATTVMAVPVDDLEQAAEYLLDRAFRSLGRMAGDRGYAGSKVAAVLARAASMDRTALTFYDPACGLGETLIQIAAWSPRASLVGDEIDFTAAKLAAKRAFLTNRALDISVGDVLAEDRRPGFLADVVVIEPPLGLAWSENVSQFDARWRYGLPSKPSSELLWLQHALAHLSPGGVAFVITTMRPLFASGADERVRQGLVQAGCVERVISLPAKLLNYTAIPLALWVLREPGEDRTLTFVDATDQTEFGDGKVVDKIEQLLGLSDGKNVGRKPVMEVLIDRSNLLPSRWITWADDALDAGRDDLDARSTELMDLIEESATLTIPKLVEGEVPRMERLESLSDLLRVVTGRGKEGEPNAVYSEPGDVILHTVSSLKAYVDIDGGKLLTGSVVALRLAPNAQLDPYYLAGLLTGGWNNRHFSGSAIQRVKPRDLEIPVLPLDDQRALGEFFRDLAKVKQAANDLSTFLGREYLPSLQVAVASGCAVSKAEEPSAMNSRVGS